MQNPTQAKDGYDFDFENTGFESPFQQNLGVNSAGMDLMHRRMRKMGWIIFLMVTSLCLSQG
jgi:hypothetical protein